MKAILHSPDDLARLRECVRAETNAKQRDRYRAVLLAVEGLDGRELFREQIAEMLGRSRQFVDEWVGRYRAGGIEQLRARKQPGRASRLTAEQQVQLAQTLDAGPDPQSGRSAFVGRDVQAIIAERFGKTYSLNGAYKLLHRMGYSHLMPRPRHPKADPAAEEAFKKKSSSRSIRFRPLTPTSVS